MGETGEIFFSGYPKKPPTEIIPMSGYDFVRSGLLANSDLIELNFPTDSSAYIKMLVN